MPIGNAKEVGVVNEVGSGRWAVKECWVDPWSKLSGSEWRERRRMVRILLE